MSPLESLDQLPIPKELLSPKLKLSWGARAIAAYIFRHPRAKESELAPDFGSKDEVRGWLDELEEAIRGGDYRGGVLKALKLEPIRNTIEPIGSNLPSNYSTPPLYSNLPRARPREEGGDDFLPGGNLSAGFEFELIQALNRCTRKVELVLVHRGNSPNHVARLLCQRFSERSLAEGFDYLWPTTEPTRSATSRAVLATAKKLIEGGGRSPDVLVTGILRNDWLMTKCKALWPYVAKYFDRLYVSGLRRIGESAVPHLRERYARVEKRMSDAMRDRDWGKQQHYGEMLSRINGDIQLFLRADGARGGALPRPTRDSVEHPEPVARTFTAALGGNESLRREGAEEGPEGGIQAAAAPPD